MLTVLRALPFAFPLFFILIRSFLSEVVYAVFAAHVSGIHFVYQVVFSQTLSAIELDNAGAVAAVVQVVVTLESVGALVVYVDHILLVATDIGNHLALDGGLLHMPYYLVVGLIAVKLGG